MTTLTNGTWSPDKLRAVKAEIDKIQSTKKDIIIHRQNMSIDLVDDSIGVVANIPNRERFTLTPHALRQLGQRLQLSGHYIKRLQAAGFSDLLQHNLQELLSREADRAHMLRTFDGKLRAVLSDAYRPVDNGDILSAVIGPLTQAGFEVWDLKHDHDGGMSPAGAART